MPTDTATILKKILVEDTFPDPNNTRTEGPDEDLLALGTSMKEIDQQTPITVRLNPVVPGGRQTYTVILGHRRLKAAKLVGMPTLNAIVTDRPLTDKEILLAMLAENKARKDLTPKQHVDGICRVVELHPDLTSKAIAAKTGYPESEVCRALAIKACPVAYAALADGRLKGISDAYAIAKAAPDQKAGLLNLRLSGVTRDGLARAAKTKVEKPEAPSKPSRISMPVPKVKATVVVTTDVASIDGLIGVLTEALELARKANRENLTLATARRTWADKAKHRNGS